MNSASTTRTVSTSSVTTVTEGTSDGSVTQLDLHEMNLSMEAGSGFSDSDSGMVALVGGDATAVGENTLATGDVTVQASSTGVAAEGYASSTFTAAATSPDGTAYAGTTAYTDIYGGADRSFSLDFNESDLSLTTRDTGSSGTSSSTSISQDYALDLTGVVGTGGSSLSEAGDASSDLQSPELDLSGVDFGSSFGGDCGCGDFDLALDGNVALANVSALAIADDSLVTVDLSALAIEDQYSGVTISALAAVA